MMIIAVDGPLTIDRGVLHRAIASEFGADNVQVVETPNSTAEYDIKVRPADAPRFILTKLSNGSFTVDGMEDQDLRTAVIVNDLLPREHGRVIALQPQGDVYVDLTAGITAEQTRVGWRNISEGGFE